jgi:hypothetical protein
VLSSVEARKVVWLFFILFFVCLFVFVCLFAAVVVVVIVAVVAVVVDVGIHRTWKHLSCASAFLAFLIACFFSASFGP